MAKLIQIVAVDSEKLGIGNKNTIPWKCKTDMQHFKTTTTGNAVIMGRKTWESLGGPLPGRLNIVLTKDESYLPDGAIVFHNKEQILDFMTWPQYDDYDYYVIGGAQIYDLFEEHYDEKIVSYIKLKGENKSVEFDTFMKPNFVSDFGFTDAKTILRAHTDNYNLQVLHLKK